MGYVPGEFPDSLVLGVTENVGASLTRCELRYSQKYLILRNDLKSDIKIHNMYEQNKQNMYARVKSCQ